MKRFLLDTNIVVRFLLGEATVQGQAAASLFALTDGQEVTLLLEPLVFAETIFVLTSFYKRDREAVANSLEALIQSPGIECGSRAATQRALALFKAHPRIHWVDCFLGAASAESSLPVASFDTDFDSLAGAARYNPATLL